MLPRDRRLRQTRDINRVYARGRFGGGGLVSAKALVNHADHSRAVVVVSRKISKKAVVRNRLRRRLSAILAAEWQTVSSGYDIVITVRQDTSSLAPTELKSQLTRALKAAGVSV